jgi:epoxide hydrolase 4
MSRTSRIALVAAAASAAGALATYRAAYAPPDPVVQARAEAAQHSGPWRHGFVTLNTGPGGSPLRMHYAEIGPDDAPLVVLLHGFPECWYEWHLVMPRLAERFHVIAPDLRGFNWSDKPTGVDSYAMPAVATDIAALIESLGHTRAHIVGHDWGGSVAWALAIRHPERVDRLVVTNAPHPKAYEREIRRNPDQLLRSYYVFLFQIPVVAEAVARVGITSGMVSSAYVPGTFSEQALDVYRNGMSQPGAATAMLNYYRAAFRDALRQGQMPVSSPSVVAAPTLLLWGLKDFALSPNLTDDLDEWIPNLRVQRIEDCGHWVPEEKPHLTADALLDFLGAPSQ